MAVDPFGYVAVYARRGREESAVMPDLPDAAALLISGSDDGHCIALRIEDRRGRTVLDCDSQQWLQVCDVLDAHDDAKWADPAWWASVIA